MHWPPRSGVTQRLHRLPRRRCSFVEISSEIQVRMPDATFSQSGPAWLAPSGALLFFLTSVWLASVG